MDSTNSEQAYIRFQERKIERLEKRVEELEKIRDRLLKAIEQYRDEEQYRNNKDNEVGSLMQKLEELEFSNHAQSKYGKEPESNRQKTWSTSEFDIFISYSRHDHEKATVLATTLMEKGLRVWWDQRSIRIGENFESYILWALEDAMRVIVLWSSNSLRSPYVYAEARVAYYFNKLLPVLVEDVPLPNFCADIHAIDLSSWAGDVEALSFKKLVDDLKFYCRLRAS